MEFRPAKVQDVPDLTRLMIEAIDGLATRAYDADELAQWKGRIEGETLRRLMEDPSVSFIVAEDAGVVVAFGTRDRAVIRYLYVHPAQSGRGLGAHLMERLESEARQMGLEALELDASRNAVGFYRRMGFAESGAAACSAADAVLCKHMVKALRA